MSTRANILIRNRSHQLWLYRHCDGYPSVAMLPLMRLMEWLWAGRISDDVDADAGWLVLLGAVEENYDTEGKLLRAEYAFEPHPGRVICGSMEPTSGRHGDIEYLYLIDLYAGTLTCYAAGRDDEDDRPDGVRPRDKQLFTVDRKHPWAPQQKKEAV